jgi:hypothetical protein
MVLNFDISVTRRTATERAPGPRLLDIAKATYITSISLGIFARKNKQLFKKQDSLPILQRLISHLSFLVPHLSFLSTEYNPDRKNTNTDTKVRWPKRPTEWYLERGKQATR